MSAQTVRTTAHSYPLEEIQAMQDFYGDGRCVISSSESLVVQWCHMLDVASMSSDDQLSKMLSRNLREDRHPGHASEVRENIVPMESSHHLLMDGYPPQSTLFLHEDILARTLAYEQDLQAWRCAELSAGRPDPGRPAYGDAFGLSQTNSHRYHLSGISPFAFVRKDGDDFTIYKTSDCPGIDDPTSARPFPVIPTLLSIPFSLLNTTPRLAALLPLSTYQTELLAMAAEIIHLWWWDPSPQMLEESRVTRRLNIAADRQNDGQSAKPLPIHDPSRTTTTFVTMRPTITFGARTTNFPPNLNWGGNAVQRDPGPVIPGPVILAPQDHSLPDGILPTAMDKELSKENIGVIASPVSSEAEMEDQNVIDSPTTSEAETKDSDITIGDKSISSIDIALWAAKVIHAEPVPQPLPLTPAPFERGVIASMSANDILMIKGLINPVVYVDFFDLGSFSDLH